MSRFQALSPFWLLPFDIDMAIWYRWLHKWTFPLTFKGQSKQNIVQDTGHMLSWSVNWLWRVMVIWCNLKYFFLTFKGHLLLITFIYVGYHCELCSFCSQLSPSVNSDIIKLMNILIRDTHKVKIELNDIMTPHKWEFDCSEQMTSEWNLVWCMREVNTVVQTYSCACEEVQDILE